MIINNIRDFIMYLSQLQSLFLVMSNKIISAIEYTVCSTILYFVLEYFSEIYTGVKFNNIYSFRFSPYHEIHIYYFLVTIGFSFLVSLYIPKITKIRPLEYTFFYLKWIVLSSIICGILWSYYDMKNGWFPPGELLYQKIANDIINSISYGYIVVLASFPFNILILIISFSILKINKLI